MDSSVWITIMAIVALVVAGAFFSAAETALTAASRPRLHQLAAEGNRRAALVNRLRDHKEALLGTLLTGNTLVNILSSAIATSLLIRLFGDAGVAMAAVFDTLLILIFAEVLPKTYALHRADSTALWLAPLVRVCVLVLTPITAVVTGLITLALKLTRADMTVALSDHTEELRGVIELHRGPDEEVRHERAMLRSILDLADVSVADIMTHRRTLVLADADLPPEQLVEQVLACPYTRVPLWRDNPDNIVGVLHVKALLREVRARQGDIGRLDVKSIAAKPWFIPDTTTLYDQLQAFRQRREHFALVVDEYGSLMGVVTLEDILEEIVGDITDETDVAVAGVHPQPNGSYVVDGTVTIRDLNRQFEWGLPDDAASTIAGLVLHEARRIPEVGQTFTFYGFRFEILRRQRHQITTLRITPPQ